MVIEDCFEYKNWFILFFYAEFNSFSKKNKFLTFFRSNGPKNAKN